MPIDAVLFDLDGTLADTLADIADAMNRVLTACGLAAHDRPTYREWIGGGVASLVAHAVAAPARRDEVLAGFRIDYAAHLVVSTAPYPGIIELIAALAARRLPLAVVSNKPAGWTEVVVDRLFPGCFAAVIGQSDALPSKPDPAMALAAASQLGAAPNRCLFVGDTAVDVATAAAAGMVAIGVEWGLRPTELAGAAAVLEHPLDLLDLLQVPE